MLLYWSTANIINSILCNNIAASHKIKGYFHPTQYNSKVIHYNSSLILITKIIFKAKCHMPLFAIICFRESPPPTTKLTIQRNSVISKSQINLLNSLPSKMLEYCVYFFSLTGYRHTGLVACNTLYTARHSTNHKLDILVHDPLFTQVYKVRLR